MDKRKLVTKILAGLLVAGMLIGLLPMFASAEGTDEGTTSTEQGDLYLDKSAVLQPDGTWTITLEAYATGVVKTEVRTQVTPTDIILVLDQSGSMTSENVASYVQSTAGVTNATLTTSSAYYHKVAGQYFPFNSEYVKVTGSNYFWEYYDEPNGTAKTTDKDDTSDLINTSWTAGNNTYTFAENSGYYNGHYMVYQLATTTNNRYQYQYVAGVVPEGTTPGNPTASRRQNQALNSLRNLWGGWSVSTSGDYALVYLPAELTDDGYHYYKYYYTDAAGNKVYLDGTSETSAAEPNISDATYWGTLYTIGSITRLAALKSAATTFINDMSVAANEHQVDHRIAVVGFASDNHLEYFDGYDNDNTELFIGGTQYNYFDANNDQANGGALAATMYGQALQSVNTPDGYSNLIASINSLAGHGATYPSYGFLMAQGIAGEYANATAETNDYLNGTRKLVVVFMTDGQPGEREQNWDSTDAEATQNVAALLESTYGATVYTVALLDEVPPEGGNEDSFLHEVTTDGVTGTDGERYWLATDGVSLTNFFHTIEIEVDTTISTVELTNNAYMVDRVSEHFSMPYLEKQGAEETDEAYRARIENWFETNVKVYTAPFTGMNGTSHTFGTWNEETVTYDAAVSDPENDGKIHIWPTFSDTDNVAHGITVHNFNYLYVNNEDHTQDNMVHTVDGSAYGKKLIVVIEGITAKDSGAQDIGVPTNDTHSGLWDANEEGTYGQLKAFPMPTALIANRVYVLDYAKVALLDTTSSVRKALALKSEMSLVHYTATENGNVYSDTELKTTGGKVKYGDARIDNGKLYYTPMTTNWDDYDTIYVFWHSESGDSVNDGAGDPATGYGWSKVSVLPANNVYYEDTFVTTDNATTTEQGRVGIKFGEGWSFTVTDENGTPVEGPNHEHPENLENGATTDCHGWIDHLADESGFTDGTVAKGDGNALATATFTFAGTGVDIYSYTDSTVGTILVKVKPVQIPDGYTIPTRYFIVDNYAASGEYYQIPTISYTARGSQEGATEDVLVHGTYEVTITVTAAAADDGGRVTYYLDGIRVYNPLSFEKEDDVIVNDGYRGEVHAFFYNIRDYLISEGDFDALNEGSGAVFIDQIKQGQSVDGTEAGADDNDGLTVTTIGTYKDYGPKNEVYLANNQKIVMKVDIVDGRHWFVSLKSPTGEPTTVNLSNGSNTTKAEVTIDHTSDLYYEVVPNVPDENNPTVGYIVIENTGNALLSVTKYQITGLDSTPDTDAANTLMLLSIGEEEAVTFAATFAHMASVPYTGAEAPEDTESENTEQNPEIPEIDIDNPEPETPDEPSIEDEIREKIEALVARLFKSVRDWFNY